MKWFNLTLLLVASSLTVMIIIEPVILDRLEFDDSVQVEPLPQRLKTIRLIRELPEPLEPRPIADSGGLPKSPEVPIEAPVLAETSGVGTPQFVELPVESVEQRESSPVVSIDHADELSGNGGQDKQAESEWRCFNYGPFESFAELESVGRGLVSSLEVSEWGEYEEPYTEQRHWVALNSATNNDEVALLIQQLNAKGFRDHYRPGSTEHPFLISLGLFKEMERAQRHRNELERAGFDAEILRRETDYSRRWLSFRTTATDSRLDATIEAEGRAWKLKGVPCGVLE